MGGGTDLLPTLLTDTLDVKENANQKENAMNATEYVLFLSLIRLIIPFGLILLIGEWMRKREANSWMKS